MSRPSTVMQLRSGPRRVGSGKGLRRSQSAMKPVSRVRVTMRLRLGHWPGNTIRGCSLSPSEPRRGRHPRAPSPWPSGTRLARCPRDSNLLHLVLSRARLDKGPSPWPSGTRRGPRVKGPKRSPLAPVRVRRVRVLGQSPLGTGPVGPINSLGRLRSGTRLVSRVKAHSHWPWGTMRRHLHGCPTTPSYSMQRERTS